MILKIDFESEIPIYEQLRRQLIEGIARGELKIGEELPSVRRLAEDIGINLHTVNKSYNILKDEGYLVIDRRKGAMVKDTLPNMSPKYYEGLESELRYIIADAFCRGMGKEDFLFLCEKIFDNYIESRRGEIDER